MAPARLRPLRKWLLILFFSVLLLIIALTLVLTTETGLQLLLRSADRLSGSVFSVEQIEGRLLDSWRVGKVQVHIQDVVDVTVDELHFSWDPKKLIKKKLLLHRITAQGLTVRLFANNRNDKKREKDAPVVLPKIKLPFDLHIEDLRLRDGTIYFSENAGPFIINECRLQAFSQNSQNKQVTHVTIQQIKLDIPQYSADLQGKIDFQDAWPLELRGGWRVADPGVNDLNGSLEAKGDLNSLAIALALVTPAEVTLQGQITDILNGLRWRVTGQTGHFHLNDIKVDVPVDGTLTILEASGTAGSYRGTLAADIHYQGYPKIRAETTFAAEDYSGLTIDHLSVFHDATALTVRGKMNWSGGFSWQAELEGKQVDPSLFAEKWSGKINGLIRSKGELTASGKSMELSIDRLQGTLSGFPLEAGGGLELDQHGVNLNNLHLQTGSNQVEINGRLAADNSLDLKVRATTEDLSTLMPEYHGSIQLQGTATGSPENPGIKATLKGSDILIQGYALRNLLAELNADLIMEGKDSGMTINNLRLLLDKTAAITATGQIGWANGLSWRTEVTGEHLDPSLFLPEWPGKITTKLQSQGNKNADKWVASVQLDSLEGELRGYPLSGDGKAAIEGREIQIEQLRLQSGSTSIQLDGRTDAANNVNLTVLADSDDLRTLVPGYSGAFQLRATANGNRDTPHLRLALSGSKLASQDYKEYALQALQADVDADLILQGKNSGVTVTDLRLLLDNKSSIIATGQVGWADGLSWKADLSGEHLDPSLFLPEWPGNITTKFQSQGNKTADKWVASILLDSLVGELRGYPLSGDGKAAIDGRAVQIEQLRLQSGSTSIQLDGWTDADNNVNLTVLADSDDLRTLAPGYSGAFHLRATANGNRDNPHLQLALSGSKLASEEHKEYVLRDLQADVNADLNLQGKDSGVTVTDLRLLFDNKSSIIATGQVGWADGLSWKADLSGEQLDPSLFVPEWPGNISTKLRSQGKMVADKLVTSVQLDHLDGKLRGYPLSGNGKAVIDGKAVQIDQLRLRSGSSRIQLDGRADLEKQLDLNFQVRADDLATLLPDSSGKFQLTGTVSGSPQQPDVSLSVSGSGFKMKEYQVDSLTGEVKADLSAGGIIDAEIKASKIRVKEEKINTVVLRVKGSPEQHKLDFSAVSESGEIRQVRLAAAGGIKKQQWRGKLTQLQALSEQFGEWTTKKPAALLLSNTQCSISDFNFAHERLNIALNGQWEKQEGWRLDGKVDNFALSLLQDWNVPVPDIQGVLTASLEAQGRGTIPEQADFTVSLPDFALTAKDYDAIEDGEEKKTKTWHWKNNQIKAKLSKNTAHIEAQTLFQDGSDAKLDLTVENCNDFSKPEKMPLSGKLNLNIKDLTPLAQLSDDAVQATGEFGGDINLRGTVSNPTVNGMLALKDGNGENGKKQDGEIHILAAGIDIRELQLAFEGDAESNKVNLQLASGEGKIQAEGLVKKDRDKHWLADFSIIGKNFRAANLPEYQAVISPDLHFIYGKTGTTLSGTVLLPKAHIAPTGFGGAVSSSNDIVIIDENGKSEKNSLPMTLDLTVTMGEEVALDTFGLKGFLDGSLKIDEKPGRPITGLGNLYLRDSTFDFEGNILQLSQGRIFYQGGPIDDPGLDIQASRKIDKVEIGVRLIGSASNMEMNLFTDTAMDESEILSYLLTGQDVSKSSSGGDKTSFSPAAAALGKLGGGALLKSVNPLGTIDMEDFVDLSIGGGDDASDLSLVMGKEIYKDLYISYGKDLTGGGGTFKARYDLKYGFSVETSTNSKTNGADLLWSLER